MQLMQLDAFTFNVIIIEGIGSVKYSQYIQIYFINLVIYSFIYIIIFLHY